MNKSPEQPKQLRALINDRCIEVMDRKHAEIMRQIPGERRLELAFELGDRMRQMMASAVHQAHPNWSAEKVRTEVAKRVRGGSTK